MLPPPVPVLHHLLIKAFLSVMSDETPQASRPCQQHLPLLRRGPSWFLNIPPELRGCPKLGTISQERSHLCSTVGSAGSTRGAELGLSTPKVRADPEKLFLAPVAPYRSQLGWFGCGSGWKRPEFLSARSQSSVWGRSMSCVVLHQGELLVLASEQISKQTKTEMERKSELFHQRWD